MIDQLRSKNCLRQAWKWLATLPDGEVKTKGEALLRERESLPDRGQLIRKYLDWYAAISSDDMLFGE